jgi:hypothetical protein
MIENKRTACAKERQERKRDGKPLEGRELRDLGQRVSGQRREKGSAKGNADNSENTRVTEKGFCKIMKTKGGQIQRQMIAPSRREGRAAAEGRERVEGWGLEG